MATRDGAALATGVTRGLGRAPVPRAFATETKSAEWTESRYHNLFPSPEDWRASAQRLPLPGPPAATLITDFNSYNTDVLPDDRMSPKRAGSALVSTPLGRRLDPFAAFAGL